MASEAGGETLSLQNGVKCVVKDSVLLEKVLLAMGEKIGCQNIYSASWINKAVVVFLTKKTLMTTATSFPSFGKFTSPMKPIPLGCKSSSGKHVLSFRRQVLMVLNDQEGSLNINFKVEDGNNSYTVFATTKRLRCFECGDVSHKRLSCLHEAMQLGSSWGDTAGKQRQQREDSWRGSTEESVPAVSLADTPELQKVSPEHTSSTETHPASALNSTPVPQYTARAQNLLKKTTPLTSAPKHSNRRPAHHYTTKPRRKREETFGSQTHSTVVQESEEAGCSTAHTPVDIGEQVNYSCPKQRGNG